MARSRSRRTVEIPDDYLPHDGKGCPVDPDSHPQTIQRGGTRTTNYYAASFWIEQAGGSSW